MRIEGLDVTPLLLPLSEPYDVTGDWRLEGLFVATVELRVSDGTTGIGYACTYNRRYLRPLVAMIEALGDLLIGRAPSPVEEHWELMLSDVSSVNLQGLGQIGIAALDIALWDLKGKREGRPVYRLLGGTRERLPAYASGYFGLQHTTDECLGIAAQLLRDGFRAMKFSTVNSGATDDEVARVAGFRSLVGADVDLMVDCFQAWSPAHALQIGKQLEPYGLMWIEDPCPVSDLPGMATVAKGLRTPIASGEWFYTLGDLERITELGAADILMVDIERIGGFTGWQRVAAHAAEANKPIVPHLMTEVSAHALSAAPTGLILEYSPWSFPLFEEVPALDGSGQFLLSDSPGLGLRLNHENLQRYRIE